MRENTHPLDQEEVMAYLDGELASEAAAQAAEHLRECRECQELAADLQSVSRRMASWQITAGEPQQTPAIATALQERETKFATEFRPQRISSGATGSVRSACRAGRWRRQGAALVLLLVAGVFTMGRMAAPCSTRSCWTIRKLPAKFHRRAPESSPQDAVRIEGAAATS